MFAFVFSLAVSIVGFAAGQHVSDNTLDARYRSLHKEVIRSEAIGRWIRPLAIGLRMSKTRTPTRVLDGFSSPRNEVRRSWSTSGLVGTQVEFGEAGPVKGTVIYDRAHARVFYGGGCCTYGSIVLAAGISPPPVRVMDSDLRSVKTDTGLRLGDSPGRVRAVYGASPLRRYAAHRNVTYLLYQITAAPHGPCVQYQTFGFTRGRLSYIELGSGC